LDLLKGVFNFAQFCGISFEEALPYATENPAVMTGIYDITGSIAPGKRADILMLGSDKRTLERVWVRGAEIK
ncbi:MAG: amidohydrolase family protein, partial [Clostridia bacterium]|nr:amidohydrolase family protein [Clostridia bacterium]